LFGAACRIDLIEFWLYVSVVAAVSVLALAVLDPDLMQERMRSGGRRVGLRFVPMVALTFLHRAVAGIDRGRLHASDTLPEFWRAQHWSCSAWCGSSFSGQCM
jgi:hypothetical protein